jgi:hypothetical protein
MSAHRQCHFTSESFFPQPTKPTLPATAGPKATAHPLTGNNVLNY